MFGIKTNKLEAWFETLPADTRKKLESTSPEKWNSVLAQTLSQQLKKDQQESNVEQEKHVKSEGQNKHTEQAVKIVKNLGAASVAILERALSIDSEKAQEIMSELEQKGVVENGQLQSIRRVYNADNEEEIDEEAMNGIVAHLLEQQTISAEVLENKFGLNDKVIPIVLDALEESGFISS